MRVALPPGWQTHPVQVYATKRTKPEPKATQTDPVNHCLVLTKSPFVSYTAVTIIISNKGKLKLYEDTADNFRMYFFFSCALIHQHTQLTMVTKSDSSAIFS